PDAMSGVVFPGTTRSLRVTDVKQTGNTVHISGEITDQMGLLKGESTTLSIEIDRSAGLAQADFLGSKVVMRLDAHDWHSVEAARGAPLNPARAGIGRFAVAVTDKPEANWVTQQSRNLIWQLGGIGDPFRSSRARC